VIPRRISFARSLPVLALVLSCVLIVLPVTITYVHLQRNARDGHVQRRDSLPFSLQQVTTSHAIQAMNLPGSFVAFPIDKLTKASPEGWSPKGMTSLTWRAITFPLFCLPFWWLAGVGLDGVLRRRWLRWWMGLAGSVFCVFYLALFLAISCAPAERREMISALCGLGFWILLLSAFPLASVRQWLTLRRTKAGLEARLFAELQ